MPLPPDHQQRIRRAWEGRISGCLLGKAVEVLSLTQGRQALASYLGRADALPLRDYVPLLEGTLVELTGRAACRGRFTRAEWDDDINYTVLALMLLEEYGIALSTVDVARTWLRLLPAAATWTAERAAYRKLLEHTDEMFAHGGPTGFDVTECSDNPYSDWIGAQIRADMYGWVCPGQPALAADLARQDASLSHRGAGVDGAAFIAAFGAAIPVSETLEEACHVATTHIPENGEARDAVTFARSLVGAPDAVDRLHDRFKSLPPIHTLNNLAVVVWAILSHPDDYSAAVGEAVAAGWDTDCNGATVGGLWGLTGQPVPAHWTAPWRGRVAVTLAGVGELDVNDLARRTVAVAERIAAASVP